MPLSEPSIELADAEKRTFIALVQASKALSEKYRFTLFQDQREVGLQAGRLRHGFDALVSAGFTFFSERPRDRPGLDFARANMLGVEGGAQTCRGVPSRRCASWQ